MSDMTTSLTEAGQQHEPTPAGQKQVARPEVPLLGQALGTPQPSWETQLSTELYPWLGDHRFRGRMVFPGMGYLELAVAAGRALRPEATVTLHAVKFPRACLISDSQPPTLQTIVQTEDGTFTIHGRRSTKAAWTLHARGLLRFEKNDASPGPLRLTEIWDRCPTDIPRDDCYRLFREHGLDYGSAFQGINQMWRGQGECLARLDIPQSIAGLPTGMPLHPATVDACLHVLFGTVYAPADSAVEAAGYCIYLPLEVAEVRVHGYGGETLWSHGRLLERSDDSIVAEVRVFEETGRIVCEALGLHCQAVGKGAKE